MTQLTRIIILLALVTINVFAADSIPAMQHKKVVETNHYYSDTDLSVVYNVANVEKSRSLIFVLRNKKTTEATLDVDKNNIKIVLKSGNEKT